MTLLANPMVLALQAIAIVFEPPAAVDYLAFAERHIVFRQGDRFPGPYSRKRFPYFDEILRALSPDDPCRIVSFAKSAQLGGTVLANIFALGSMTMDPNDFLYTHPTEDNARRWSKTKLSRMIADIDVLSAAFPQRPRDGLDSVLYKERRDGRGAIIISGANSPASLSMVSMPRQVQDDLSKWEKNAAGDPEHQADTRSQAYEFAKLFKISTPLVAPGCRITRNFEQGSREHPYVPCPHCGELQVLEWENMLANLDPDRPERAHFTCVACGAAIEETDRAHMMEGFEWRAHNSAARRIHRSFWLWSAYSPLQSWERIARSWLRARGNAESERVFENDVLGLAHKATGEAPPWEALRDRATQSYYAVGAIPAGALLLTIGIDVQKDRVEWQAVAWGRDFRRYVVVYGVSPGHVSEPECQARLDALLRQTWPNAAGRRVAADIAAIDGNAWTEDVWSWAKRHPRSFLIMVRGRAGDGAPRIARVKRERNERTGKLLNYVGRFFNFGADIFKDSLYRDLKKTDPAANGYVAFPRGLEDSYFQGLTAERRVVVSSHHGFERFGWVKEPGAYNEPLDTMNQAEAAATKWGVRGLPDQIWDRLEQERETPPAPVQGDIEDLLGAPLVPSSAQSSTATSSPSAAPSTPWIPPIRHWF